MTDPSTNEHQWALETAAAIREGRLNDVDLTLVADQIHSIATGLEREFISRLRSGVLAHLKGLQLDADLELNELRWLLERYPTLIRGITQEDIDEAYQDARELYMGEVDGAPPPTTHPFTIQWILDHEYFPPVDGGDEPKRQAGVFGVTLGYE